MGKRLKRVPVVYQIEAAECGAASMCMILGYYGKYIELSDMRRQCKVSRDGSKLSYLMKAAENNGLEANAYRKSARAIDVKLPAIIFWKYYHFMVLERITDKWVYICDPAAGRRRITHEEFEANYSGIILELTPTNDFKKGGKPFKGGEFIRRQIGNQSGALIFLSILYLFINMIGVIIPGMTGMFVDNYMSDLGVTKFGAFFAVFAGVLLLQFLLIYLRIKVTQRYYRVQSATLNRNIIKKILELPTAYFQTRSHSSIVGKLESIEVLSDYISTKLVPLGLGLAFSVIYTIMLFYNSPIIGFISLTVIAITIILLRMMISKTTSATITASNEQLSFMMESMQTFKLFETIKATAGEKDNLKKNINAYNLYENAVQKSKKNIAILSAIPVAVPLIIQTVVVSTGSFQVMKGTLTVGALVACQSIATSIFSPIAEFISGYAIINGQEVNTRGLHDIESESKDELFTREGGIEKDRLAGRVEIRNVSFGYNSTMGNIVEDINATIEPGRSIAFVGGSGAGKTTLLRLIEGLYEPNSGEILFDGHTIKELSRGTVARSVAVVSQSPAIFRGSVRDNITLFDNSVSIESVIEATKAACIYEDIISHEGGFNAMLDNNGHGYSGGQIQRMMLARALLKKPSILILDEATSALDVLVEEEVMNNIRALGITMLIVAHRLSTIRDCDEILVLDHGHIVERGTHEELMGDEYSYYKELVKSLQEAE